MTTALSWRQLHVAGDLPQPRCSHGSAVHGKDIYIYGGWRGLNETTLADVYQFDTVASQWHKRGANASGDIPSARSGHSFTRLGDHLAAFGGLGDSHYLQDLQLYSVADDRWAKAFVSGELPPPRSKHSMSAISASSMLLFGGGDQSKLFNDVHLFDAGAQQWLKPHVRGPPPAPRWGHTAVVCGQKVVLHGGFNGRARLADVHILDTRNMCWVFMSAFMGAAANKEAPVAGHVANALSDNEMLVWGGGDGQLDHSSSLFSVDKYQWRTLPNSAHGRCAHTCDLVDGVLYAVGGGDGQALFNDVWTLDVAHARAVFAASGAAPLGAKLSAPPSSVPQRIAALYDAVELHSMSGSGVRMRAPGSAVKGNAVVSAVDSLRTASHSPASSPSKASLSPSLRRLGSASSSVSQRRCHFEQAAGGSSAGAAPTPRDDVPAWVSAVGLQQHWPCLREHDVGEAELPLLRDEHLERVLGMESAAERARVLAAIAASRGDDGDWTHAVQCVRDGSARALLAVADVVARLATV